jgi:CHASE3 domain sensor protein
MNTASEKSGLFISIAIILAVVVGGVFYATVDKSARHDLTVTGSARESLYFHYQ